MKNFDRKAMFARFLREELAGLADLEYQKRVWLRGEGPEIDSVDEAYCTFFGDYEGMFTEMNEGRWAEYGLNEKQYKLLMSFYEAFDNYDEPETTKEHLADPKWLEIVEFAKKVYRELKAT